MQRLRTLVPEHLLSHSVLSSCGLLCAVHSLAILCLCTTSGPDPGELLGFWGFMVFRHVSIPQKVSGKQHQQQRVNGVFPVSRDVLAISRLFSSLNIKRRDFFSFRESVVKRRCSVVIFATGIKRLFWWF